MPTPNRTTLRALVTEIDAELRAHGSPVRAENEKAYLKSSLEHYGASVPAIRSVAKAVVRREPKLGHDDLVGLVVALWEAPVHERRMAAVELLVLDRAILEPREPELVYEWLLPRAARASGVTVREAVKPLSEHQRAAVLAPRTPPGSRRRA